MFSRLFESISYPLISFVFFIFIVFMYLINKRYNSYSNRIYRVLLILTFITSITTFVFDFSRDDISIFKDYDIFFARLYTTCMLFWATTYSYYLIINTLLKDASKKKHVIAALIAYGITLILFIWTCFEKVEFGTDRIYTIVGDILTPLYIELGIVGLIYMLSLILGHKHMNKTQFVMHTMILIILILVTLLRFFANWEIDYFCYFVCLIPIALYFSSESSSYLQSIELEKSKKEFETSNELQNQKIMSLSSELINPFSNILYSNELINENNLTEEQIKNEKIKIYNETKKIYDLITITAKSESEVQNND